MILKDTTLKKTQMTSKYFKVFETSTSLASRKCNIKLLWYSSYHQQKKSGGGGRQDLIQSLWEGAEVILAVNKVATETIEKYNKNMTQLCRPGYCLKASVVTPQGYLDAHVCCCSTFSSWEMKQPRRPSIRWTQEEKVGCRNKGILSAVGNKLNHGTEWSQQLESVTQPKMSQAREEKYHVSSHTGNLDLCVLKAERGLWPKKRGRALLGREVRVTE